MVSKKSSSWLCCANVAALLALFALAAAAVCAIRRCRAARRRADVQLSEPFPEFGTKCFSCERQTGGVGRQTKCFSCERQAGADGGQPMRGHVAPSVVRA